MYRSKFKNLQLIVFWFIIDLLVSVAYTLMEKARLIESKSKTSKKGGKHL